MYLTTKDGKVISPWHDIPLHANDEGTLYNMVVEIPLKSDAKMEISTTTDFNPIMQDLNDDETPRFVSHVFPYPGYLWNYGAFPQTWEDPDKGIDGFKGDNDPLDVLEIGNKPAKMGQVLKVKVLGAIGLIDNNETDWKILVIDNENPMAPEVDNISNIEEKFPTLLKTTIDWLQIYKYPKNKHVNSFAFNRQPILKGKAIEIIDETHQSWKSIKDTIQKKPQKKSFSLLNTTRNNAETVSQEQVKELISKIQLEAPQKIDPSVSEWQFVPANIRYNGENVVTGKPKL